MAAANTKKTTAPTHSPVLDKEYRLTDDRSPVTFLLRSGRDNNLVIYRIGDKQFENRAIRYAPNEKSIFLDEQSQYSVVEQVIFEFGRLVASRENQTLQKFLDAHPGNVKNGGNIFEELDYESEAKTDIEYEELVQDVKQAIRTKSKEENGVDALEMVVSVLSGSLQTASEMTEAELKRYIYLEVDRDPYYFVNDDGDVNVFDDETMQRKYITLRALKDGIIKKSPTNRSMHWGKDNQKIMSAPPGQELTDMFVDYLSTDDGMLVLEEIMKRK